MTRQLIRTVGEFESWEKQGDFLHVALDTETTSLKYMDLDVEGISLSNGLYTCYIDLIDNPQSLALLDCVRRFLARVLVLIGHNLVFDLKVLRKFNLLSSEPYLYCTMVADHLLDENREHGLKYLAEKILGKETKDWDSIKNHQSQEFYDYAMNDVEWTWELMKWQAPQIEELGMHKLFYKIEMPFQWVLLEMEINGVMVDRPQVSKITEELRSYIEDLEVQMYEMLEIPYTVQPTLFSKRIIISSKVSFTSGRDLREILFTRLGLSPVETTGSGLPSVNRKTIDMLKDKHPFVGLLHKYKVYQKLLTAFFEPLPEFMDNDGRVRPNFRDTGTVTGRLSCQNPNLQQLPKNKCISCGKAEFTKDKLCVKCGAPLRIDTRACFIATPGHKMIGCDYSGQELRVLAQVTMEPILIDNFIKGRDMHLATANDFFNLNIPEDDLYETSPKHKDTAKKYKAERDKAKTINFGIAYGKGAFGFSKDFGISEEEAQQILDRYFAALPGVKSAIDQCHERVRIEGRVRSMAGRYRHFIPKEGTTFYPGSAYRESFNFLIQGFSADMIRKAAIMTRQLSKDNPSWGLKTIASIHDEILYEVREEHADEAAKAIKQCFETAVKFVVPVVAEVSIGNNYSEAK